MADVSPMYSDKELLKLFYGVGDDTPLMRRLLQQGKRSFLVL